MADKKILLFAVLLLAACTADPAMDGADGGNSSANTAAAAKLINTPYDAKQGSLIVCFDDAAVPTIEATAASFAATRGDAGDAAVLTRSALPRSTKCCRGLKSPPCAVCSPTHPVMRSVRVPQACTNGMS